MVWISGSLTGSPVAMSTRWKTVQSLPPSLRPYAARPPVGATVKVVSELVPSAEKVFGSTSTRPPSSSSGSVFAT